MCFLSCTYAKKQQCRTYRYNSLKSWKIDNIDLTEQFSLSVFSDFCYQSIKSLDCYRFLSIPNFIDWLLRVKISNISRIYCSNFLDLTVPIVAIPIWDPYCHRKPVFVLCLDETSSGLMNFKDSFPSAGKFSEHSYRPVTLLRASARRHWGVRTQQEEVHQKIN